MVVSTVSTTGVAAGKRVVGAGHVGGEEFAEAEVEEDAFADGVGRGGRGFAGWGGGGLACSAAVEDEGGGEQRAQGSNGAEAEFSEAFLASAGSSMGLAH